MPCVVWSQKRLRRNAIWHGGLNNFQSPDPFRVRVNVLHNSGTLKYHYFSCAEFYFETTFEGFFWGPYTAPFCNSHLQYFDMFSDLVDMQNLCCTFAMETELFLTR